MHFTSWLTLLRTWIEEKAGDRAHVTAGYEDGGLVWLSIRATRDGPCPFAITPQGDDRISICFGEGSVYESWVRSSSEVEALLDDVRSVVELIIDGRVVEEVWEKRGKLRKIRATFEDRDTRWNITTVPPGGGFGRALGASPRTVEYQPYVVCD